jgi:16S rRNA (guanine527-N7)-methyltransferase|tara:strand:- start:23048 stop:23662 length:615 start_codon:yes stop_codon:yes gene_type:complete
LKYFDKLKEYFPELSNKKINSYKNLYDIYEELNSKINLISRKDFENFYLHHVLHSLSIIKLKLIKDDNIKVIDIGTGGGFPGVPLSIYYDSNEFILIDSMRKKINAIKTIKKELKLKNITLINNRIENENLKFDIALTRAVSSLSNIYEWTKKSINKKGIILNLKGGNIDNEIKKLNKKTKIFNLSSYYSEKFFETKKIVLIQA